MLLREIFRCSGAANYVVSGPIWPKFELIRGFMHDLFTASINTIGSKTTEKRWRHHFPHCKSQGGGGGGAGWFCCHGNRHFKPICPKTLCSIFLTPIILHIKFDKDWPTDFRDIQVQMGEIVVPQGQILK